MQQKIKFPKWLNNKTFGIFISILFLFLIFHNINLKEFLSSIKSFNLVYAIPAIITYALSYVVRAFRWRQLLSVSKKIKYTSVLKALYIGYMANTLLPARMGELYRAHIIGTEQKIKRSAALASIVAERIFDGLTLFSLLVLLILFVYKSPLLLEICITTGFIFLTGLGVIIAISRCSTGNYNLLCKLLNLLPEFIRTKLETIVTSFIDGLGVITSFRTLLFIILTSISAWFLEWATMFYIVSGFNLDKPVAISTIAFLVVLVAFSTMIPSGPAFVGPYQYAFILALDMSSIAKDTALGIAVTTQFIMVGPVVVIGMILLWHSHLSFKGLSNEADANAI